MGPQEMDTDSPSASCPLGPLSQVDGFDYKHIPVAGQIFQAVGSFPLLIPFVRPTRSGAKAGPRETLRQEQRKWKVAGTLSSKKQTENQGTYLGLLQCSGSPAVPSLTVRGTPIRSRHPAKPLLPLLRLCRSSWRGTGVRCCIFGTCIREMDIKQERLTQERLTHPLPTSGHLLPAGWVDEAEFLVLTAQTQPHWHAFMHAHAHACTRMHTCTQAHTHPSAPAQGHAFPAQLDSLLGEAFFFFFFFLRFYLFMRDTERKREKQRHRGRSRLYAGSPEGEAGSMQGARHGFRISRITPWTEGCTKPLRHLGCPEAFCLQSLLPGL